MEETLEKSGKLLRLKLISKRVARARNCSIKKIMPNIPGKTEKKERKPNNSCVEKNPMSISTSDRGPAEPCEEGRRSGHLCVK